MDQIIFGNCLEVLKSIESGTVQLCVTSPPYWRMRDYGVAVWFDGSTLCEHDKSIVHPPHHKGQVEQTKWKKANAAGHGQLVSTYTCSKCGAWYGQLGQEPSPELYVNHLVEIFQEVHRVLREDGLLWLNVGDTYITESTPPIPGSDLKVKDLVGIPWMVAQALRSKGWWLRSDTIWNKPNTFPESVEDRPTKSHEYLFMLAKSENYFYDGEAIKETALGTEQANRHRRSVWSINTTSYKGAHFAVFPVELPKLCILAGSREGDLVLDPFVGSGTTTATAESLGRRYLGIEQNVDYKPLIEERMEEARAYRQGFESFHMAAEVLGEE